jgi:hypothetical protein
MVTTKDGVDFAVVAPAGFVILAALKTLSAEEGVDLVITSACDGVHSGPGDPHHSGEAYDVRSHDFALDRKAHLVAAARGFSPSWNRPGRRTNISTPSVRAGRRSPSRTSWRYDGSGSLPSGFVAGAAGSSGAEPWSDPSAVPDGAGVSAGLSAGGAGRFSSRTGRDRSSRKRWPGASSSTVVSCGAQQ